MAQSDTATGDGTNPVTDTATPTSATPATPTPDTPVPTSGRRAKPPEDDPMSPDYRFDTGGG